MDLTPQKAIEKYNIPLETPAMDPQQLDQCSYVLIRHGLSGFNYKALVVGGEHGEDSAEFKAVQTDPEGIDPELHPVGVMQSEAG